MFSKLYKVGYLQATNDQRMIGSKWNTPLINAVVLYVGSQAIQQIQHQQTQPSQETVAHNAFMDIFQVARFRNGMYSKTLYFRHLLLV